MTLNSEQAADIVYGLQKTGDPKRNEALIRAFIALEFFDSEERLDELVLEWENFRDTRRKERYESHKKGRSGDGKLHG